MVVMQFGLERSRACIRFDIRKETCDSGITFFVRLLVTGRWPVGYVPAARANSRSRGLLARF